MVASQRDRLANCSYNTKTTRRRQFDRSRARRHDYPSQTQYNNLISRTRADSKSTIPQSSIGGLIENLAPSKIMTYVQPKSWLNSSLAGLQSMKSQPSLRSQPSKPHKLPDILVSCPPILESLCSHLDIKDLLNLAGTNKALRTWVLGRWNIDSKLSRYFRKPKEFRSQLGNSDALITGGFAVQFLDRANWEGTDLHIVVQSGTKFKALTEYLEREEGYEKVKYGGSLLPDIFVRADLPDPGYRIVISTTISHPVNCIIESLSTTMMGIISWNKAYSLFPDALFKERKVYMMIPLHDGSENWISRFDPLGFTPLEVRWPQDKRKWHSLTPTTRRVGDAHTWVLPLDTVGVVKPKTPDLVLELAHFSIRQINAKFLYPRGEYVHGPYYAIAIDDFRCLVLKYIYCVPPESEFFWNEVCEKCDSLVKLELLKIQKANRPQFPEFRDSEPGAYFHLDEDYVDRPSTWTYWDDEIPRWYEAWVKKDKSREFLALR